QEIYKDRQKFSDQVFRVASSDLVNMGISVVSYTLKDVHDEQIWDTLGETQDTTETHSGHIWDTLGNAQGQDGETWGTPRYTWDTPGGNGSDTAGGAYSQQAITAQQGEVSLCHLSHVSVLPIPCPWQAARSQQAIAAQRGEVALVERAQRAQLQEQEVGRRRQELEATVRKPAEAERYRLERLAEAQR
ncbi:FLOT1 protein, partial [Zosterops hypoxanthus]|nr:FLOT1 protein [Zosterops hypoxanthus]